MSTEFLPARKTGATLVMPFTGEVIELDQPSSDLAKFRDTLTQIRASLSQIARTVDEELAARLDAANRKSAQVGGWKLAVNRPDAPEYNLYCLRSTLADLVETALLEPSVIDETISEEVVVKVDHGSVRRLLDHPDPRVRNAIGGCVTRRPQQRRVEIKRT